MKIVDRTGGTPENSPTFMLNSCFFITGRLRAEETNNAAQGLLTQSLLLSSLLKKPPGEGTGPTIQVDFRGSPVGRVPSHGERALLERAAKGDT